MNSALIMPKVYIDWKNPSAGGKIAKWDMTVYARCKPLINKVREVSPEERIGMIDDVDAANGLVRTAIALGITDWEKYIDHELTFFW